MPEIILMNFHRFFDSKKAFTDLLTRLTEKYSRIHSAKFYNESHVEISIADKNSVDQFLRFMRKNLDEKFSFLYVSSRSHEVMTN